MIKRIVGAMALAAAAVLILGPAQASSVLAGGGSCNYHCMGVKGSALCC